LCPRRIPMRFVVRAVIGLLVTPVLVAVPLLVAVAMQSDPHTCTAEPGDLADGAVPPEYAGMVNDAATAHDMPARWLAAVITAESGWNPRARSPVGAMGLGQLMPSTAKALGVTDPWDPRQSIDGAARYLAQQF